jgi:hypothetical protein
MWHVDVSQHSVVGPFHRLSIQIGNYHNHAILAITREAYSGSTAGVHCSRKKTVAMSYNVAVEKSPSRPT